MEKQIERISINAEVYHCKSTVRGLRYLAENLLELLARGMTSDKILEGYPDLDNKDLSFVLEYASKVD